MSPLVVGGGVAAILAGPPLYSLVQSGQMDGTSALLRGLLVAAVCVIAVAYLLQLIDDYDRAYEKQSKQDRLLEAIAQAEEAHKRHEEALAKAAEQNNRKTP
jgi:predicted cobalt transporter CbtA